MREGPCREMTITLSYRRRRGSEQRLLAVAIRKGLVEEEGSELA